MKNPGAPGQLEALSGFGGLFRPAGLRDRTKLHAPTVESRSVAVVSIPTHGMFIKPCVLASFLLKALFQASHIPKQSLYVKSLIVVFHSHLSTLPSVCAYIPLWCFVMLKGPDV